MSSFYRDKKGRVIVQYYDPKKKYQTKLSRKKYSFLDTLSDSEVKRWVEQWAHQNIQLQKVENRVLFSDDESLILFERFLKERAELKNLEPETVKDDLSRFHNHIAPFFVTTKGQKDIRNWDNFIPELTQHLLVNSGLSKTQISKNLSLLKRFSEYLFRMKLISAPWLVLTPSDGRAKSTPLKIELSPNDVLSFVKNQSDPKIQLMALLGYFGSLRPGETFALTKQDFYTGDQAITVSKTYLRLHGNNLGSRMTVHINKQLKGNKSDRRPKTERSIDYVTVWHKEAAKLIAQIVKDKKSYLFHKPEENDVLYSRDYLFRLWKKHALEAGLNSSLHDLRRASGLYLGRVAEVSITLLQDHMRHTKLETTEEYMRRPKGHKEVIVEQDFEDVG